MSKSTSTAAKYMTATAPALVVLGFFVWFANWIPQTRWEPPKARQITAAMRPIELAKLGETIARERGCFLCHTIEPGGGVVGRGRGPNLWNLASRRARGVPNGPDKPVDYLVQALYEPAAYLVEGFANIMPPSDRAPAKLNYEEVTAVVAYLQSLGGTPTVKVGDLTRAPSEAKPQAAAVRPADAPSKAAPKDAKGLLTEFNCLACHSTKPGEVLVGPPFEPGTLQRSARERGMALEAFIVESIVQPRAYVRADFEKPETKEVMPDDYGQQLTAAQLWAMVNYLVALGGKK